MPDTTLQNQNLGGYQGTGKYGTFDNVDYGKPTTEAPYGTYNVKSPVTSLSTDNAQKTLQSGLDTLNGISPKTAPGYQAPPPPTNTGVNGGTNPTGQFQNAAGTTATYTQAQLNDPSIQQWIKDNGFVPTDLQGLTYNPNAKEQGDVNGLNDQISGLTQNLANYNVDNDPNFQSMASNIRGTYDSILSETKKANAARQASLETIGLRTGATQYAGGVQSGVVGEELRQADARVADIVNKENAAISSARLAYQTGKFSEFNTQISALSKLRDQKQTELTDYNKTLSDTLKKAQAETQQVKRDTTIAALMGKGMTDPKNLLESLKNSGISTTADELQKSMKSLADSVAGGDLTKLTGAMGEYYSLLQHDPTGAILPPSIRALPKDQQPFAYVKYKGDLGRAGGSVSGAGGGGGKGYTFSNSDRGKLLGVDVSPAIIDHIQQGLSQGTSLSDILTAETGLNEAQKNAFRETITGNAPQFITPDYIKSSFDVDVLKQKALDAGFTSFKLPGEGYFNQKAGVKENDLNDYVNLLMDTVKTYRDSGLTDKEIAAKLDTKLGQ